MSAVLEFDRAQPKASGGKYWSKRYRTDHRIYIAAPPKSKWTVGSRGGYSTDTLTPLDEVYAPKISSLPYVVQRLCRSEFWNRVGSASWPEKEAAAAWLQSSVESFGTAKLDVAYDFEEIEACAKRAAEICRHIPTYEGIREYTEFNGAVLPKISDSLTDGQRNCRERGCVSRARSHKWWRRQLSRKYRRRAEEKLRRSGFVRKQRGLYCSSFAMSARRQQMRATFEYLRDRVVVSSSGEQLPLIAAWNASVSNPAVRRPEMMTRMRGFEDTARECGHHAEFITLTAPSEYHAINADGKANPNYKGHTVRETQAWLNKMWARSRAKLKKLSILIYGFRVGEAHHDGTPHWHMVLFTDKSNIGTLRTVLRGYWLSECGSEPGALHHRVKFESINYAKGSATGYLSKYIAKNIDGFGVGDDYEAQAESLDALPASGESVSGDGSIEMGTQKKKRASDATNTSPRVRAWASLHGIRQFQQIGGPQVTLYRELRRCRNVVDVAPIERARVQADAGNWSGFIKCNGGIEAGRKGPLALWKEIRVNKDTGETRANSYGEPEGAKVIGISSAEGNLRTRLKTWRIEKVEGAGAGSEWVQKEIRKLRSGSGSALGPVSITVAGGLELSDPHGWTNPNETSMYGPN